MDSSLLVLVVDDDPAARESLTMLLRLEGYEVVAAADGQKAKLAASRECPDVVLLDVGLPGNGGYEVGRALKEARPAKPPFVVAVSGFADDPARRDEAGIDLQLSKPVDPEGLCRVLGRFGRVVEEPEGVPPGPLTVRPRQRSGGRDKELEGG
jgi:CheY-like chemotaxis protein